MNKICALLLATIMLLTLAACDEAEVPNDTSPSTSDTTLTPTDDSTNIPTTTDADNLTQIPDATDVPNTGASNNDNTTNTSETDIKDTIQNDVDSTIEALNTEWNAMKADFVDYSSYVSNVDIISAFYQKINTESDALCTRMYTYALEYAQSVIASGKSADEMYDDMDNLYDWIYDDAGEDIYDGIYDGILDDMYDTLYDGILKDRPDDIEYSEWSDHHSDEYDQWSDTHSDAYDQWSDYRSDVYDFWSDVRSELFNDDIEGAKEEITDFSKDIDRILGNETQAPSTTDETNTGTSDTGNTTNTSESEIKDKIQNDVDSTIEALNAEWNAMKADLIDYPSYVSNVDKISAFYQKVNTESGALCARMYTYAHEYAQSVIASGKSTDEMYDDMDNLYDWIYDDAGEDIYDGIYNGILDDMYDTLYGGIFDDIPDDVEYSEWSDYCSNEYDQWSDTSSDAYDQWSDYCSDVYDFWSDVNSELFNDDIEGAKEEISDFLKKAQNVQG